MAAVKVHLSITRPGPFGGTVTSSLCGRARIRTNGMNLTADPAGVTCAFCRALLDRRAGRGGEEETARAASGPPAR